MTYMRCALKLILTITSFSSQPMYDRAYTKKKEFYFKWVSELIF